MDYFYSILAGIIQGLTEFLPVSSSGHLVLFHDFLGFDFPDDIAFDVVLHLGTLVALVTFFFKDILRYLKAFFQSFYRWNLKNDRDQLLAWYLLIGTVPAAVAGYFFENEIESIFRNSIFVAIMLIVFGLLLLLADSFFAKTKEIKEITFINSLVIGFAQALALVPGVSRSGITIIAGLSQRLKRLDAARFSFLLSIPIVFAAGIKKSLDLFDSNTLESSEWLVLFSGFLASAVVGYLCIKYFLKYLENHTFKIFVYYRIALGLIIFMVILFFR